MITTILYRWSYLIIWKTELSLISMGMEQSSVMILVDTRQLGLNSGQHVKVENSVDTASTVRTSSFIPIKKG